MNTKTQYINSVPVNLEDLVVLIYSSCLFTVISWKSTLPMARNSSYSYNVSRRLEVPGTALLPTGSSRGPSEQA